jgi:hypothetical protein
MLKHTAPRPKGGVRFIRESVIGIWLKRRQETGDYHPLSNRPKRTKAKITDWQAFEKFAERNGEKTQCQMAVLWGEPISPRTISKGLRIIASTSFNFYYKT